MFEESAELVPVLVRSAGPVAFGYAPKNYRDTIKESGLAIISCRRIRRAGDKHYSFEHIWLYGPDPTAKVGPREEILRFSYKEIYDLRTVVPEIVRIWNAAPVFNL